MPDTAIENPTAATASPTERAGLLPCDIVMEGGVTSGIVYPTLVGEVAARCAFRSIGGTSVGAIAAALTAAAEYRRTTSGGADGSAFERLREVPAELGQLVDGGRTRLLDLFQPYAALRPLFAVGLAALKTTGRPRAVAGAVVKSAPILALAGAVVTVVLVAIPFLMRVGWSAWPLALGGLLCGIAATAIALALRMLLRAYRLLPAHGFGFCGGAGGGPEHERHAVANEAPPGVPPGTPLSVWLSHRIDNFAGLARHDGATVRYGRPLTFGDLWFAGRERPRGEAGKPDEPAIELEMMTTCLTHGRPYRTTELRNDFFFDRSEMLAYLPEYVVAWMCERSGSVVRTRSASSDWGQLVQRMLRDGKYLLPPAADLPVVFAARMSMSFPGLLSAVKLYTVNWAARRSDGDDVLHASPCWFSDGGLISNFPIHFFDRTLPDRPTFGVVISSSGTGQGQAPWMPRRNSDALQEQWRDVSRGGLPGFVAALLSTMRTWGDAMQSRAPGYRDRIVHIVLGKHDGGLNLMMSPEQIQRMSDYGAAAGRDLLDWYQRSPRERQVCWQNHRWVRYRVMMAAMEQALQSLAATYGRQPAVGPGYHELLDGSVEQPSYRLDADSLQAARVRTEELATMAGRWSGAPFRFDGGDVPKPQPELRARPRV